MTIDVFDQAIEAPSDFCLVTDDLPHIVWVCSPDGQVAHLNRAGREFFGPPTLPGGRWSSYDLMHPADVARAVRRREKAGRELAGYELDIRVRRFDGEYHWATSRGAPLRPGASGPMQWVGTLTLIDDKKRIEQQLLESHRDTEEALALLDALQQTAPVGFIFLDPDLRFVRVNETAARMKGVPVEEIIGRHVADVVPYLWDSIRSLHHRVVECGRPVVNEELLVDLSSSPEGRRSTLVSAYPVLVDNELRGYGVVIVDISERKRAEQAQKDLTLEIVEALSTTVETRDPYTAGHQRRVAEISAAIGEALGLDPFDVDGVRLAAHIHDIGKIAVPAEILSKPTRLTQAEFEIIKTHSRAGYEIVKGIAFPWPVAEMILQHHERLDGSGYPDGLLADAILPGSRIIAVADVLEAMATHRPYRPARGVDAALAELSEGRGRRFDSEAVDACAELVRAGRIELSTDFSQ